MAINAVAPWQGTLEWVGEVRSGQGTKGTWKSVDFCLKYTDHQMAEKYIVFSAFGEDKVDKLLSLAIGTELKVVWWPEANQSRNGMYYGKNSVLSIGLAQPEAKSADTKIRRPDFPETRPPEPWKNPIPEPNYEEDLPNDDSGLPFR